MRKFSVKVNGVAYDVEIEELGATASSAPAAAAAPAPVATAAPAAPAAPVAAGNRGAEVVKAPIQGTLVKILAKAGTKVAEQAKITLTLKRAEPLMWTANDHVIDLSTIDEASLAAIRQEAAGAMATSLVRPLINVMGKDADWFFRDIPAEAVQSIIDAAASADQ
jgi:hypothetical protein